MTVLLQTNRFIPAHCRTCWASPGLAPDRQWRTASPQGVCRSLQNGTLRLCLQWAAAARCQTSRQGHQHRLQAAGWDDSPPGTAAGGRAAGIPLATEVTTAGERLAERLRTTPAQFVSAVLGELHQVLATTSGSKDRFATARRSAVLEDCIYYWALGEAYLRDRAMQQQMREALGRAPDESLSEGADGKRLVSEVQLVPGAEGNYLIGSVQYSRSPSSASAGSVGVMWGGQAASTSGGAEPEDSDDYRVRPALDKVFASKMAGMLMAVEGGTPSRMNREGAARTYHMYAMWGYFNRRMHIRRQMELNLEESSEWSESAPKPRSEYGESSSVWKYFENVPDELCELRLPETTAVCDRHLRTLFGDQEECLTTLIAWQHMNEEAKQFGRALYDAEEIVLSHLNRNQAGT